MALRLIPLITGTIRAPKAWEPRNFTKVLRRALIVSSSPLSLILNLVLDPHRRMSLFRSIDAVDRRILCSVILREGIIILCKVWWAKDSIHKT